MSEQVVAQYLDLLDTQRKAVFAVLEDLREDQIWQRPAPGEWSIGEILSHTARFMRSFLPALRLMWALFARWGRLRRDRPHAVDIENPYKRPSFPMWTGFLWKPRNNHRNPIPRAALQAEVETAHLQVREFYQGKDPAVMGHIHAYDPAIGVVNLITSLKVCLDHDQLHYDDVVDLAETLRDGALTVPIDA